MALRRATAEIVVVDNGSPAHAALASVRRLPGVSLRRWRRNHGFSQAVNEGARLSEGDWLLVLNPDITVPPGFLDSCLTLAQRFASTEPRAGIVGFQLRNGDGSRQFSTGPLPTFARTIAGLALPRTTRKYLRRRPRHRCRVPWVTGCCFLVRRDCFQAVGGFDGDFFLYYEDVDLCQRAAAAGWSVWYEPSLRVTHHCPLQVRTLTPNLRLITRHALLAYAAKHWAHWQAKLLNLALRLEAWWHNDACSHDQSAVALDLAAGRFRRARRRLLRALET
jgi:GT2 family glycosyltransferase